MGTGTRPLCALRYFVRRGARSARPLTWEAWALDRRGDFVRRGRAVERRCEEEELLEKSREEEEEEEGVVAIGLDSRADVERDKPPIERVSDPTSDMVS